MKKLLTALCTLITFTMVTVFCFTGCSPVTTSDESNKEKPWIEVQSITYCIKDGEEKTLTSILYRNVTEAEWSTQEEFEKAPEEQQESSYYAVIANTSLEIPVKRKDFLEREKNKVGKTIYLQGSSPYLLYSKFFIESYELRYVKIRFVDNGGMEINYYETSDDLGFTTISILPVSYEITYFIN